MSNPKLETIRKVLAMAEGAATPEEAEAFGARAEALMAKYSIDRAEIAALHPERKEALTSVVIRLEGYAIPKAHLLNSIAANLSCQAVMQSHENGRRLPASVKLLKIYGHESDVEAFEMLATSLLLQATTASTATHRRPENSWINGKTYRHNFLLGFASRVNQRMEDARKVATEEASTGTAVALVDRSAAVQAMVRADNDSLKSRRSTSITDERSFVSGDRAGAAADLGTAARVGSTGRKSVTS